MRSQATRSAGHACSRTRYRIGALSQPERPDRGVSPVIGVVLLIAIVVVLAAVVANLVLGPSIERSPPHANFEITVDTANDKLELKHGGGGTLVADRTRIVVGIEKTDYSVEPPGDDTELDSGQAFVLTFDGSTGSTGRWDQYPSPGTASIDEGDDIEITLYDTATNKPIFADTIEAGPVVGSVSGTGGSGPYTGGAVQTGGVNGLKVIAGDGGSVTTVSTSSTPAAIGPAAADLDGDGDTDTPYVSSGGQLRIVDGDGTDQLVATDSDLSGGEIEEDKTQLAVGTWDGTGPSIFFADENHDALYRVRPGQSPTQVTDPGDGVQAVIGIADIDGDDDTELVFADASQQVRYLESDGSIHDVASGGAGSNIGIGSGSLADFDGDGDAAIVVADGSNDIKILNGPNGDGTQTLTTPDTEKSSVATADVDGDSSKEIIYLSKSDEQFKYVDDVASSPTVEFLLDASGSKIDGSADTGVAS